MKIRIVAKVILQNSENKILALRRSGTDIRRPLQWDLPGGAVDAGETLNEAASRETQEEAGVNIAPQDLALIYVKQAQKEDQHIMWLFFSAHTDQVDIALSEEHAEHTWLTLDEAIEAFEYNVHLELFNFVKEHKLLN